MSISTHLYYRTLYLGKRYYHHLSNVWGCFQGMATPSPETVTVPAYKDGHGLSRLCLFKSLGIGSGDKDGSAESCCNIGEPGTCLCEVCLPDWAREGATATLTVLSTPWSPGGLSAEWQSMTRPSHPCQKQERHLYLNPYTKRISVYSASFHSLPQLRTTLWSGVALFLWLS